MVGEVKSVTYGKMPIKFDKISGTALNHPIDLTHLRFPRHMQNNQLWKISGGQTGRTWDLNEKSISLLSRSS